MVGILKEALVFFVHPLSFSLSICNGWGGSRRSEAYRHPTIKYEIEPLLKDLMEWPSRPKSVYVKERRALARAVV